MALTSDRPIQSRTASDAPADGGRKLNVVLQERPCPICGDSKAADLFAPANVDLDRLDEFAFASRKLPEYMHWQLWRCAACDLLYASPAPQPGQLAGLYDAAAFSSSVEARRASKTYGGYARRILSRLPDRAGALDIGTGDGAFLHELLDMGFSNVAGVEPSAAPIQAADARVKGLIRKGLFDAADFPANSFSLVTCFQTIEHVIDPLALCRDVARILKPGGALMLIGHNRRAVSAKLLGRKSPIFDIEHLQLFSPRSAARLLTASGFTSPEVWRVFNSYPISYWTQLFPFPARVKKRLLGGLGISGVGRIRLAIPAGNLGAVGFKLRQHGVST